MVLYVRNMLGDAITAKTNGRRRSIFLIADRFFGTVGIARVWSYILITLCRNQPYPTHPAVKNIVDVIRGK
jgi:hypothetical protein